VLQRIPLSIRPGHDVYCIYGQSGVLEELAFASLSRLCKAGMHSQV